MYKGLFRQSAKTAIAMVIAVLVAIGFFEAVIWGLFSE
jgi:hypothetical protein